MPAVSRRLLHTCLFFCFLSVCHLGQISGEEFDSEGMEIHCIENHKVYCHDKLKGFRFHDGCHKCKCVRDTALCQKGDCDKLLDVNTDAIKYCDDIMKANVMGYTKFKKLVKEKGPQSHHIRKEQYLKNGWERRDTPRRGKGPLRIKRPRYGPKNMRNNKMHDKGKPNEREDFKRMRSFEEQKGRHNFKNMHRNRKNKRHRGKRGPGHRNRMTRFKQDRFRKEKNISRKFKGPGEKRRHPAQKGDSQPHGKSKNSSKHGHLQKHGGKGHRRPPRKDSKILEKPKRRKGHKIRQDTKRQQDDHRQKSHRAPFDRKSQGRSHILRRHKKKKNLEDPRHFRMPSKHKRPISHGKMKKPNDIKSSRDNVYSEYSDGAKKQRKGEISTNGKGLRLPQKQKVLRDAHHKKPIRPLHGIKPRKRPQHLKLSRNTYDHKRAGYSHANIQHDKRLKGSRFHGRKRHRVSHEFKNHKIPKHLKRQHHSKGRNVHKKFRRAHIVQGPKGNRILKVPKKIHSGEKRRRTHRRKKLHGFKAPHRLSDSKPSRAPKRHGKHMKGSGPSKSHRSKHPRRREGHRKPPPRHSAPKKPLKMKHHTSEHGSRRRHHNKPFLGNHSYKGPRKPPIRDRHGKVKHSDVGKPIKPPYGALAKYKIPVQPLGKKGSIQENYNRNLRPYPDIGFKALTDSRPYKNKRINYASIKRMMDEFKHRHRIKTPKHVEDALNKNQPSLIQSVHVMSQGKQPSTQSPTIKKASSAMQQTTSKSSKDKVAGASSISTKKKAEKKSDIKTHIETIKRPEKKVKNKKENSEYKPVKTGSLIKKAHTFRKQSANLFEFNRDAEKPYGNIPQDVLKNNRNRQKVHKKASYNYDDTYGDDDQEDDEDEDDSDDEDSEDNALDKASKKLVLKISPKKLRKFKAIMRTMIKQKMKSRKIIHHMRRENLHLKKLLKMKGDRLGRCMQYRHKMRNSLRKATQIRGTASKASLISTSFTLFGIIIVAMVLN